VPEVHNVRINNWLLLI